MRAPRAAAGLAAALTSIPLSELMYGLSMIVQRTVWPRSVPAGPTLGIRRPAGAPSPERRAEAAARSSRQQRHGSVTGHRSWPISAPAAGRRGGGGGDWTERLGHEEYDVMRQ